MNCAVCVKKIPDPEIPPVKFKLDEDSMRIIPPEGIPPVINPYDAQAVEIALRLKDKFGGNLTAISIDADADTSIIKHTLAMGADEGIILSDKAFERLDSFSIAYILSQTIKKIGDIDLVLCGRQAADWDEGVTGPLIAENLGLPLVTLAEEIDITDGKLKVRRVALEDSQVICVPQPALVTVSNEVGPPRLPSGWGIISASRKQIPIWNAEDIEADLSQIEEKKTRRKLVKLFIPEQRRSCEIIQGRTPAEASFTLAERLIKEGVL